MLFISFLAVDYYYYYHTRYWLANLLMCVSFRCM